MWKYTYQISDPANALLPAAIQRYVLSFTLCCSSVGLHHAVAPPGEVHAAIAALPLVPHELFAYEQRSAKAQVCSSRNDACVSF